MGILLGLWGIQFSIYLRRAIDQSCLESKGLGPQGLDSKASGPKRRALVIGSTGFSMDVGGLRCVA